MVTTVNAMAVSTAPYMTKAPMKKATTAAASLVIPPETTPERASACWALVHRSFCKSLPA